MDADPRVPFGAPSASPASSSRRTRRASTQTKGNPTTSSSVTLPHQRRSSLRTLNHTDSPNCLCSACHLKTVVFPRRRDGRIILPAPWLLLSETVGESISPNPPGSGESQSHVRNVVEATRSDDYTRNLGRGSEGFSTQNVGDEMHTDRGEGSSRGVPRLSGPGVAPNKEFPPAPLDHLNASETPEPNRRRSNTDRSRSYRYPKPYPRPSEQPSTSHAAGREQLESTQRPGIDPSAVYLYHPSTLAATTQSAIAEMRSWQEPYDNMLPGPTQSFDQLGTDLSRSQLVTLMQSSQVNPVPNPSTSSTVRTQVVLNDHGIAILPTSTRGSRPILHPRNPPLDRRQVQSTSLHPPRNEGQTSSQGISSSHSQPSISSDRPRVQTRHTPSSTHSQRSTPESSHKTANNTADPTRQGRFPAPTSAPSSSSFTWRPGDEEQESVIRFQEPVVHEPTTTSDQQEGQVEIKWDTERKRRQGYFSQEGGSEKSNFRLYNQSTIDFGS